MAEKEFDYMNVIPLVDVMLVLLTIVLTTSTFIATGAIKVELPGVKNKHSALQQKKVMIEISGTGQCYHEALIVLMQIFHRILNR